MTGQASAGVMDCPVCRTPLAMSERQGIEIDYCPTCRGVWLDRGELDKIIERSVPAPAAGAAQPQGHERSSGQSYYRDDHRDYGHRKRRKSFLEELFD